MSLTEDPSSSCVHASAKPAVPEYVGQRFAVINMASKYERRTGPQLTDTVDTVAGSEVSLQVKPYLCTATHCNASQSAQSAAQRESSLGEYLFNVAYARVCDLGSECDTSIMQLEPMTDAQSQPSSLDSCFLPVVPRCLKRDEVNAFYSQLNIVSCCGQPIGNKDRKHYVRMSQLVSAHRGPIWTAELSKDMAFFATAGQDGLVKIWKCLVKTKTIVDSSKQSQNDRQSLLDTSTLISAKGSEVLPPICEIPSKEYLSQCSNHTSSNISPNNSLKLYTRKFSKEITLETDYMVINTNNQRSILTLLTEEDNDDNKDNDDSTSSLSDEQSYEIVTSLKSSCKDINQIESIPRFRPTKPQFSQLSQTISQQHSTLHSGDAPPGKLLKTTQCSNTNKQTLDCSSVQSFSDDTTFHNIPFFLPAIRVFRGHAADVVSCSWSQSNFLATGSVDRTVKIWSPIRGTCLDILVHNSPVTCVLFNPLQEKFLYTATSNGDIYQWDIIERHKISWTAPHMITCITFTKNKFSPSAGVIIAGTDHGKVHILAADTLKPLFEFQTYAAHSTASLSRILALSVIEETNELLVSTSDAQIKQYCLLSMLQVRQYKAHTISGVFSAATPRTIILNHSDKSSCERTGGDNSNRFVVIGDDKGVVCLYPNGLPGQLNACTSSVSPTSCACCDSGPKQGKQSKQRICAARGADVIKSCLKVNLPIKSVCTTTNIIQKNVCTINTQIVSSGNTIVVTTADGSVICIDI